ncbi:hypothetical protein ACOME3_003867 [Neoechinorhynchus agilis]
MDFLSLHAAYYGWMMAVSMVSFLVEIVFAHVCHSLLLNVDALFKVAQAVLAMIQLLSANGLDQSTEISTFGLGRLGLIAELMNCIFLYAMSFSLMMEGVKHIVDNIRYEKIETNEYNSSRYSLIDHQHFRLNRPDLVLKVAYFVICANVATIIGQFAYHYVMYNKTRKMAAAERHQCYVDKYVSTATRLVSWKYILIHTFCLIVNSILLAICGAVVVYSKHIIIFYIDTIFAFLMSVVCVLATYPIVIKAMEILLQSHSISLDIKQLVTKIQTEVPNIANIHNLQVWQHVPFEQIATVHVVFTTTKGYEAKLNKIMKILQEANIKQLTVQPEFLNETTVHEYESGCLMKCPCDCKHEKYTDFGGSVVRRRYSDEKCKFEDARVTSVKSNGSFRSAIAYVDDCK